MSLLPPYLTITIQDGGLSAGSIAPDDGVFWVLGLSSSGTFAPFTTSNATDLRSEFGYGDGVEAALYALNNEVNAVTFVRVDPTDLTPGAYGSIAVDAQGTFTVTGDGTVKPGDDWQPVIEFTVGGTLGVEGIKYRYSLDNGNKFSGERNLDTDTFITLPLGGGKYILNPPEDSLVPLAVEIRANSIAHFADATAHNSADATAAALITLGVPATNAQAWAVLNQCRLAWISHLLNATAHDSADVVDAIEAPAATDSQSGITLGLDLTAKINPHLLATAAAAPAGLHAALATTVAPQTVAAADMIAGGIESLDGYPRAITFTTAGVTPANAPPTVDITGFDVAGAAQTETGLAISQTAATVTSTKKWRGTGLSVTYAAADGTAATIAIGLTAAVHNSADVTNTIEEGDPERGTVTAGDRISLTTTAPRWHIDKLVEALASARDSTLPINGVLELVGAVLTDGEASAIEDALASIATKYRDVRAVGHYRMRNVGESLQAYAAAHALANPLASSSGRLGRLTLCASMYLPSQLVPGATPARPASFAFAPRLARTKYATNPINTADFGTVRGAIRAANGTDVLPRAVDEAYAGVCTPERLWAPMSRPSGIQPSLAVTIAPEDSDYETIQNGRVVDAVRKSAFKLLDARLGQNVAAKPGTVVIDPNEKKRIEEAITKDLRGVYAGKHATDVYVVIDPSSVVSGVGAKLVKAAIYVVPFGTINAIEATISLALA